MTIFWLSCRNAASALWLDRYRSDSEDRRNVLGTRRGQSWLWSDGKRVSNMYKPASRLPKWVFSITSGNLINHWISLNWDLNSTVCYLCRSWRWRYHLCLLTARGCEFETHFLQKNSQWIHWKSFKKNSIAQPVYSDYFALNPGVLQVDSPVFTCILQINFVCSISRLLYIHIFWHGSILISRLVYIDSDMRKSWRRQTFINQNYPSHRSHNGVLDWRGTTSTTRVEPSGDEQYYDGNVLSNGSLG